MKEVKQALFLFFLFLLPCAVTFFYFRPIWGGVICQIFKYAQVLFDWSIGVEQRFFLGLFLGRVSPTEISRIPAPNDAQ